MNDTPIEWNEYRPDEHVHNTSMSITIIRTHLLSVLAVGIL